MRNFNSVIYKVMEQGRDRGGRGPDRRDSIADWGLIIARTDLLSQAIEPIQPLPFPEREALPRHVDGSPAQINAVAHSSRMYSVRHANALVTRPSIATCWPLLCS